VGRYDGEVLPISAVEVDSGVIYDGIVLIMLGADVVVIAADPVAFSSVEFSFSLG